MLQKVPHASDAVAGYERYVNPQWARLLEIMQMNVEYGRCEGAELHTADGRRILDFNSGYCVHNIGHNHPRLVSALKQELDLAGPAMLSRASPDNSRKSSAPVPADASPRCFSPAPAARASKP
jgi:4-aminobutyrate aminotransferase-like enzyme